MSLLQKNVAELGYVNMIKISKTKARKNETVGEKTNYF